MTKQSFFIYLLFGMSVLFLAFVIYDRHRTNTGGKIEKGTQASEAGAPKPVPRPIGPSFTESEGEATAQPARDAADVVAPSDMTPLLRSPTVENWMKEFGYTRGDIVSVQRALRSEGYDETVLNDPGVVLRRLPVRFVASVATSKIVLPAEAAAGAPIAFTLHGTAPSPSFVFTRFDVLVQGNIIRIRAIGHTDGNNEAGSGDEVTLEGKIDPLPPGDYRVEVPELGPAGSGRLVVR